MGNITESDKVVPRKVNVKRAKKKVKVRKKEELTVKTIQRREEKLRKRQEAHHKQDQALELRMAGVTYKDIAQNLGYANASSAKKAVDSSIARVEVEAAKEVVTMDLARLDEFQMRCMHALRNNGDLGQIDRILRIMDWRYRLLGVSDETIKQVQSAHGVGGNVTTNTNNVQIIMPAAETQTEFIAKMMQAVGVDPETRAGRAYLETLHIDEDNEPLPMLAGSANDAKNIANSATQIEDDVVDAEIVEEM